MPGPTGETGPTGSLLTTFGEGIYHVTGIMEVPRLGMNATYAPLTLSNFNVRGARYPLMTGVTTFANDGTTRLPVALVDAGLSFVPPNWYYNVKVYNPDTTIPLTLMTDFQYRIAPIQSPGFYGGTYDDASTLTYTWNEDVGSTLDFARIDIDDTGTTVVCNAAAGGPYVSTDGGATWIERASGMSIPITTGQACLARSNPSIMYAALVENSGGTGTRLYKSTDGGVDWTVVGGAGSAQWSRIKCNYNGTIVLAGQTNGKLYLSRNSGATWTAQTTGAVNLNWTCVFLSDDGRVLVGGVTTGRLWVSTDGGATWTERATNRDWTHVSGSSDASMMCASANAGGGGLPCVYISTDFGTTWTEVTSLTNTNVNQTATSITGNKLIFVTSQYGGEIYISQDGGATWDTPITFPIHPRFGIAMTPDGTKLVLGGNSAIPVQRQTATGV